MFNFTSFQIGHSQDFKFGFITYTVVKLTEDLYEINDCSGSWVTAEVGLGTLQNVVSGKTCLSQLPWE